MEQNILAPQPEGAAAQDPMDTPAEALIYEDEPDHALAAEHGAADTSGGPSVVPAGGVAAAATDAASVAQATQRRVLRKPRSLQCSNVPAR